MTNPYTGIVDGLSTIHRQAITALITSTECTVPCRLEYGITQWTDCPNCIFDTARGRSANLYQVGGPIAFQNGTTCPYCNGKGRIGQTSSEDLELVVLWNYKDWLNVGMAPPLSSDMHTPEGFIQTISVLTETISKLKRANFLIAGTDIENYVKHKFERFGEPSPCGFGASDFVVAMWKRV